MENILNLPLDFQLAIYMKTNKGKYRRYSIDRYIQMSFSLFESFVLQQLRNSMEITITVQMPVSSNFKKACSTLIDVVFLRLGVFSVTNNKVGFVDCKIASSLITQMLFFCQMTN